MKLSAAAAEIAERNYFFPTEEISGGYCSHIYADDHRVLKVPFRGEELVIGFLSAISIAQVGGPKVIDGDPTAAIVLMERICPGTILSESGLSDERSQDVAISFMRRLPELPTDGCFTMREYFTHEDSLLDRLIDTTDEAVFLHGDLHHGNILRHGDEWRIIDGKGVCGDRTFEAVAYLRNPIEFIGACPNLVNVTRNRILRFAEALGLDPWRMAAWGLVDQTYEQRSPGDPWFRLIEVYRRLMHEFGP